MTPELQGLWGSGGPPELQGLWGSAIGGPPAPGSVEVCYGPPDLQGLWGSAIGGPPELQGHVTL